MEYRRCGAGGLKLPRLSYGIWHGFSGKSDPLLGRALIRTAVDAGITHLDAANVYGPRSGARENKKAKAQSMVECGP